MNIFISHSSKDKWAARRISEDLILLGTKTFLDEKDIETGQSIDASVIKHLNECSDFLIIISPASIKSEWVLIELGGALALRKKIIPILLYVGVNEIPKAINLKLARDINSIQLYYEEVKQAISRKQEKVISKKKEVKQAISHKQEKKVISKEEVILTYSFKPGDRVFVVPIRPPDIMRQNALIDWEPEMDKFLGKEFTIETTAESRYGDAYVLKDAYLVPGTFAYVFAKEWLFKII
jgi:hypothetical protein